MSVLCSIANINQELRIEIFNTSGVWSLIFFYQYAIHLSILFKYLLLLVLIMMLVLVCIISC